MTILDESTSESSSQTWSQVFPPPWKFLILLFFGIQVTALAVIGVVIVESSEISNFGVTTLIAGGALLLSILGGLTWLSMRPRRLVLHDGRLEYSTHMAIWRPPRSISLTEIEVAVEVTHPFSKKPHVLIIRDSDGQLCAVGRLFMQGGAFQEFKTELMDRLDSIGILSRVSSNNATEQEKIKGYQYFFLAPATLGFLAVLGIVAWLQGSREGVTTTLDPRMLDLHLLEIGALWQPSVLDGRWDRLLTSSFLHSHLFEVLAAAGLIAVFGGLVEHYLGAARTLIIILTGCLAGGLVSLVLLPEAVVFGAWSAGYALFGTGIYGFVRRRSELVISQQTFMGDTGSLLACSIFFPYIVSSYISLSTVLLLAISGIISGYVMAHIILTSSSSLRPSSSKIPTAIATGLVIAFAAGLAQSYSHFKTDESTQITRIQWAKSVAESAESEADQAHLLRLIVLETRNHSGRANKREIVREFIRHSDLPGWRVADTVLYRSNDYRCFFDPDDPDGSPQNVGQAYHNKMSTVLSEKEFQSYMERAAEICGHREPADP